MALPPEDLFAEIGGQPNSCTLREYCAFAEHVQNIESCRLLVFGVGRDSSAWRKLNHGNPTLFLENNEEWIHRIGEEIGKEHILNTTYQQRFEEWEQTGFASDKVALPTLENAPFNSEWDCVFVDAPWGPTFGRHQSTYAATKSVRQGGFIGLHDCEREREQVVCKTLLEANGFDLVEEVERLRIYQSPS
jgi:hypothetical protein